MFSKQLHLAFARDWSVLVCG